MGGAGGLSGIVEKYEEMGRWLKEGVSASTPAAWFLGCLDPWSQALHRELNSQLINWTCPNPTLRRQLSHWHRTGLNVGLGWRPLSQFRSHKVIYSVPPASETPLVRHFRLLAQISPLLPQIFCIPLLVYI